MAIWIEKLMQMVKQKNLAILKDLRLNLVKLKDLLNLMAKQMNLQLVMVHMQLQALIQLGKERMIYYLSSRSEPLKNLLLKRHLLLTILLLTCNIDLVMQSFL
jgi:hypothetical protein